ncbi:MAG: hypothetical protein LLG20_19210 [Acidobacteriales bacterium]|nr:hypothetical protein [Terriglobales bacterium]
MRIFCALLAFLVIEAFIFRSGVYSRILEPSSTAGQLVTTLAYEQRRGVHDPNQVVAVGDSRMALRARIANESSVAGGYTFATISVPGTSPRCWFYMLREVDPGARRYAAVIIPVNEYEDDDWEDLANRTVDVNYLVPLLRLGDVVEFSTSFPNWRNRWEAFRGSLLKGWSYRRDFQELLAHSEQRMNDVKWVRENGASAVYNWVWPDRGVQGLSVDWATKTIHYPADSTAREQEVLRNVLLRPTAPETGKRAAYRRKWFGKIIRYYRGSRTKVIFLRLPRGPVIRPDMLAGRTSAIREFTQRREAILVNEHLFDDVERPELFSDPLHMNGPGSEKFTLLLAAEVRKLLGPPTALRQ